MYEPITKDLKDIPEFKQTHEWYDMTREEQMKSYWGKIALWYKHNPERYLYSHESRPYGPQNLYPGVGPLTLHYAMFVSCIERLGSDEQGV